MVAPSVKFPNGWVVLGEIGARQLSGQVPTNINGQTVSYEKTFLQYALEAQVKPFLPMDVNARAEHDVVPAADAAAKGTTYTAGALNLYYSLFDWWDIYGSGARYMFSDSNTRSHLGAGSSWLVYDPLGLHLGLLYDYATSDVANQDYWTPYQLNRFYAEAFLRKTYHQIYYNLGIRYGVGRQHLRPEAYQTYQDSLNQLQQSIQTAINNKWSATTIANFRNYYNTLLANPPQEESWKPVLDLVAAARVKLGKGNHWELNGEISYNNVPDYNALSVLGGIKYKF